jgi:hypothetical protein
MHGEAALAGSRSGIFETHAVRYQQLKIQPEFVSAAAVIKPFGEPVVQVLLAGIEMRIAALDHDRAQVLPTRVVRAYFDTGTQAGDLEGATVHAGLKKVRLLQPHNPNLARLPWLPTFAACRQQQRRGVVASVQICIG